MKSIKTLVDKPEYMHHAYFIPDALGFMKNLKINPIVDRMISVERGFNTNPHAFNFPSFHRNTNEVRKQLGNRGIIAQTTPSSRPKNTNAEARWRIIINPSNTVIQGPNILNTIVDPQTGYFVMRGPTELTRTTDEKTRFIEHFNNSHPNVNKRAQIIKRKLKQGEGVLFLNTTLHRPPPERTVGQVRRQVAYQTNMTPYIMNVIQEMKAKAQYSAQPTSPTKAPMRKRPSKSRPVNRTRSGSPKTSRSPQSHSRSRSRSRSR